MNVIVATWNQNDMYKQIYYTLKNSQPYNTYVYNTYGSELMK